MEVVRVDTWDSQSLEVSVRRGSRSPICELKRGLASATGLSPVQQRVRAVAASRQPGEDIVEVPQRLVLDKRQRSPVLPLLIAPFAGDRLVLDIDAQDTILDVRFLLADITGLAAECHFIARSGTGPKATALADSVLANEAASQSGGLLHLWYELEPEAPGRGTAHRSVFELVEYESPDRRTLQSLFRVSMARYKTRKFLGTRKVLPNGSRGEYEWLSYGQADVRITNFGSGLRALGLRVGDKVGVMAINRAEWAITDFTCACFGFLSVTLYDTLGPDVIEFIINHSELRCVVVEPSKLSQIVDIRAKCPSLEFVIVMDDFERDHSFYNSVESASVGNFHTLSAIERMGASERAPDANPSSSDVASICYTSGTTGNPKGAQITHRNLVSAAAALSMHIQDMEVTDQDCVISYLPLAHIYERLSHWLSLSQGIGIGYYQGDTTKLLDDVATLRPTLFPGVPRVWQKIYDRVNAQIAEANFIRRSMFGLAFDSKEKALVAGIDEPNIWDKLVFSKVSEKFGGRLRCMVSGSAPISSKVATFMKVCAQSLFTEGYGLTETCAASALSPIGDCAFGQVGFPLACAEIMLVDVPDMNYMTSDRPCARGEIWIRGPAVFAGYFKEPGKTSECMSDDGWFMSGDIGCWRPDGRLQIIDRKKNIFKLSQGEYIRPEYIENVYKQSPYIANVFVHGDSLQRFLVAIVVPDFEVLGSWAAENKLEQIAKDHERLAANPRVHLLLGTEMSRVGKQEGLRGFEHVHRFKVIAEEFSIENGLLTPSMKLKRHLAKLHFKSSIDELYAQQDSKL